MKTFYDLGFSVKNEFIGERASIYFDNGYGVSVAKGPRTYGGPENLYELAILTSNGELCYDTPIADDVVGYLQPEDVTKIMALVQELSKRDDDPRLFEDGFIA